MDGELHHATFVVRVSWDGEGTVAGIVERVRTGAKTSFRGPDAAGLILVRRSVRHARRPRRGRAPWIAGSGGEIGDDGISGGENAATWLAVLDAVDDYNSGKLNCNPAGPPPAGCAATGADDGRTWRSGRVATQ